MYPDSTAPSSIRIGRAGGHTTGRDGAMVDCESLTYIPGDQGVQHHVVALSSVTPSPLPFCEYLIIVLKDLKKTLMVSFEVIRC